jgi:hypothetical protein
MHGECWTRPLTQRTVGQKRHCIDHRIDYITYSKNAHLSCSNPPPASEANGIPAECNHGDMSRQLGCPALSSAGPRSIRHVSASDCRLVAPPQVPSLMSVVDAQCPVGPRPPTHARQWWPYLAVAGLFWVVPGGLLLVGYLALPDYIASSQCEGSGFGCTLTPKDGTVVLTIYVYPLFVVVGWLIMAVIAMGRAWRHRHAD